MRQVFLILMLTSFFLPSFAQEKSNEESEYVSSSFIQYEDAIYKDYIASVKFNIMGADLTMPIIDITDGRLLLSFDDLDADVKDFYYTIVHCDKNWKPTEDLSELDYIEGFSEEEIDNYEYSSNTLQPFTHYELMLPNEQMRWTLSGNYILKIYTDQGVDDLVITRRFTVVDSKIRINAQITRAYEIGKMDTHQELDFFIDHEGFPIQNPKQEVSVSILQNGNWSGMISDIKPMFVKGEKLEYDYQGKIVFPGMKEFRHLDLRSFRFGTDKVQDIYQNRDGTDVILKVEQERSTLPYLFNKDINGNYFIQNMDEDDSRIRGDYALTTFSMYRDEPYEKGQLYVYGKLTDWQLMDQYRMVYNEETQSYETSVFLKNGYYNYMYAYVPKGTEKIDFSETEGNHHETDNDYTILVYYTPFGSRYDQAIAAYTLNSIR